MASTVRSRADGKKRRRRRLSAVAVPERAVGAGDECRWRAGRRAMLLSLLVAVPLVFDPRVRPAFALPKFTVAALGALLIVAFAGAEYLTRRSLPRWRNGLERPALLLLAWTAVSAAASPDPATSVIGFRESMNGLATAAVYVIVFSAVAEAFDRVGARRALSVLWFASGGAVLLYGAAQLHDRLVAGARWDPIPWANEPGERVIWSTLGNPNDLAGFLAILLPVGVVLLALARRPVIRVVSGCMIALLLLEMAVTTSRGAFLAATAATAALAGWFGYEMRRRRRVVVLLSAAIVMVVGAIATVVVVTGHTDRDLGELASAGEGTTVSLRAELWRTAWRMAEENPLFGVGPDRFGPAFDAYRTERFVRTYGPELLATDPHNVLLRLLANQGFPAVVAFAALTAAALARVLRALRRPAPGSAATPAPRNVDEQRALVAAVGAALGAYLIQAMFNRHDIVLDFLFWVLLGLLGALTPGTSAGAARPQQSGDGDDAGDSCDGEGDPRHGALSVVPVVPVV